MGDPWETGGFRGGEGLEGANRKKKNQRKNQEKTMFFFSIGGTALELTLNFFKTKKSLRKSK